MSADSRVLLTEPHHSRVAKSRTFVSLNVMGQLSDA